MRPIGFLAIAGLLVAAPGFAGSNYGYVHAPGSDAYFGHISYCDLKGDALDPLVLAGEQAEPAAVNFPLAPGSRILTTAGRRCEAQFDTGTVMRLDGATGVRIETILAKALVSGEKLTNIHLESGRIHLLYRDYDGDEVFQILTPNAALKLGRSAVVDVELDENGATRATVRSGRAEILYGPSADKTRTRKLKAGEWASVGADHTLFVTPGAGATDDAFVAWNQELSKRFAEHHAGRNALPKPIERYPRAVIEFAQKWSDPYGEWLWTDLYGYVWRPYLSRDEGWRPYQQGRWVQTNAQLFWVPDEPWGWVPYHLGLWHWDTKHGWMWIPGSIFSPAWVSWSTCDESYYYRPLSLFDWTFRGARRGGYYGSSLYGQPCGGGYYPLSASRQIVVVSPGVPTPTPSPDTTGDDQPTKPVPWRPSRDLPRIPVELQKTAESALKRITEADCRAAADRIQSSAVIARLPERAAKVELPLRVTPIDESDRFRDWNGDVRAAQRVDGRIVYSSATNAVRCEDCRRPLVRFDLRTLGESDNRISSAGGASSSSSDASGGGAGSASSAGQRSGGGGTTAERDRIR